MFLHLFFLLIPAKHQGHTYLYVILSRLLLESLERVHYHIHKIKIIIYNKIGLMVENFDHLQKILVINLVVVIVH